MSDFITDVEQQYEVYCKIAEDYGFIDFNAKKNGFRCTTKSNEFNAGWIAFTGAIAAMREDQQAKIDQLKAELALCREENKGLVGKVSEQKKRVKETCKSIDSFFDDQVGTPTQREYCNFISEIKQDLRGVNDINLTR